MKELIKKLNIFCKIKFSYFVYKNKQTRCNTEKLFKFLKTLKNFLEDSFIFS